MARAIDLVFGALVLAMLAGPGVVAAFRGQANVERAAAIERRRPTLAPWSEKGPKQRPPFSTAFDEWFDDAWGGRERALRLNARASMELFGTSPAGYLVFGRDDWVFSREARAFESFTGTDPLGPERLRDWQLALEDRRNWLAGRGIEHVVVLVPHKSTIYPEKLPAAIERARGTSRREEFLAWMGGRSDVRVIDLAPALVAAKAGDGPDRHLYSPHGVHWNGVGGHAAYVAIVNAMRGFMDMPPPHGLDEFDVVDEEGPGDSWASRMLLDGVIEMENLVIAPRFETGVRDAPVPPGGTTRDLFVQHADDSRPRVLMVHDSFGPDIRKQFAMHASYLEARWVAYLESRVVEEARPDVVIELYSELILETATPFRRAEFLDARANEAFDRGELAGAVDLTKPLPVPLRRDRVSQTPSSSSLAIRVDRGATFLDLGALPDARDGRDLWLGLDLESEVEGTLALHFTERFDGPPAVTELLPLEVGTSRRRVVLPVPRQAPGAHAWMVVGRDVGELSIHGAEMRHLARE